MKVLHISLVDKDKLPVAVAGITILACVYLVYRTHTLPATSSKCHLEFLLFMLRQAIFNFFFIKVLFFKGFY